MKPFKYIIPTCFLVAGVALTAVSAPFIDDLDELSIGIGDGEKTDFDVALNITQEQADAVTRLEISADIANVDIVKGDTFKITCENIVEDKLEVDFSNNELELEYDTVRFISFGISEKNRGSIIITVPEKQYDEISIDGGLGDIYVKGIDCAVLDVDLGVGESEFSEMTISGCSFEMGVGSCEIRDSVLSKCDINGGVGKFTINNSSLTGSCSIDGGVGDIKVNLIGDDYRVKGSSGIGDVVLNGEKVTSNAGDGNIIIDADCGVGDITINTGV